MIAHINIGSNIGDRHALIGRAVAAVCSRFPGARVSRAVESEPWGFESDNAFVNVGMMIDCDLHPEILLSVLLEIERGVGGGASHRDASGGYADRLLDIDLIDYGRMVYVSRRLTLPHPHAAGRRFVMEPLLELEPDYRSPLG
ncbi:2-amino-4-hydroxy-6-hydroxymethyldihydropteridine diphosphokinase [Paramuribaculum intestinale]|uniref:2-amino-4-hydroxy-6- hydroxymethyldihydropteridine diphosphokinase n=1 Tax=Paramuribaculum intestinale TaxID=2094151 RepID=UPI0025B6C3C0|nr:2-amino-4-hydroxy-6-hydroxymethyldihydropteridine diphosphokinase [Paramuribaculum intestinale]